MYYCEHCGQEFEEPKIEKTTYEDFYGVGDQFQDKHDMNLEKCPYCGSDEFVEMQACDKCGEYFSDYDLTDTSEMAGLGIGYLCPDCLNDCEV